MPKDSKKRLLLLFGGRSGEHEVSLSSAASVLKELDKSKYDITLLGGDKDGRWYKTPTKNLTDIKAALDVKMKDSEEVALSPTLFKEYDVVFPIIHGPLYEDGCLQGFLDICEIAYVGSGHLASAIAMDKSLSKQLAKDSGLHVAPYILIKEHDSLDEKMKEIEASLSWPVFVKPVCLGSSVGIAKVESKEKLKAAIKDAFCFDDKVLVESGIKGREIELSALEVSDEIRVSLPGEILVHPKHGFYSYDAKYILDDAAEVIAPCQLPKDKTNDLQQAAKTIFEAIGAKGLARVDFFLCEETGHVIFNEINTLPGFTKISMYPKLWQASGIDYQSLLNHLVDSALYQFDKKQKLVRDYL